MLAINQSPHSPEFFKKRFLLRLGKYVEVLEFIKWWRKTWQKRSFCHVT